MDDVNKATKKAEGVEVKEDPALLAALAASVAPVVPVPRVSEVKATYTGAEAAAADILARSRLLLRLLPAKAEVTAVLQRGGSVGRPSLLKSKSLSMDAAGEVGGDCELHVMICGGSLSLCCTLLQVRPPVPWLSAALVCMYVCVSVTVLPLLMLGVSVLVCVLV